MLRDLEAKQKQAVQQRVRELKDSGVDPSTIPAEELQSGSGPHIEATTKFLKSVASYRNRGSPRAEQLEELLSNIMNWRQSTAEATNMTWHALVTC